MLNFLYCLDQNYNTQALVSLFSLLEKVDKKINVIFLHKDPQTLINTKNFEKIKKHRNLDSVEFVKFSKENVDFPNIENTHVSEATYYRLYLSEHLDEYETLVYIDPDVVCLKNPIIELTKKIEELNKSEYIIAATTETRKNNKNLEEFKRLDISGDRLFNAGFLIIDFKKWKKNELNKKLVKRMEDIFDNIVFWDQDVLNSFFNSNYIELGEEFNFKINKLNDKLETSLDQLTKSTQKVFFAHYSGKFKPWSVKGANHISSTYYQEAYRAISGNSYHIENNWKKQALKDLIKIIKNNQLNKLTKPSGFIFSVLSFLIKSKN